MIEIGLIYDVNSSLSVIGDKETLFSKSYKKDILKGLGQLFVFIVFIPSFLPIVTRVLAVGQHPSKWYKIV